jgi:DNA-binding transcriptional LysR family regulator
VNKRSSDVYALHCLMTLVAEAHVTRAADLLGISQPAMSAMLGKLRTRFGDPLLVKTDTGMVPTERARELAIRARQAIEGIEQVFGEGTPFVPGSSDARFHLIATESVGFFLVPRLLALLRVRAPGVSLSLRPPDVGRLRDELEDGRADMMIGYLRTVPPNLRATRLRGRSLRVVASRDHPAIRRRISLEQYTRFPHACYSPTAAGGSTVEMQVESRLAEQGLRRQIALYLPSAIAIPAAIAGSDLLSTLAADVAEPLAPLFGLRVLPPPLDLGSIDMWMYWHERVHRNAAHQWFRQVVVEATRGLPPSAGAGAEG